MTTPLMVNSRAPVVVQADRMSQLNDRLTQLSAKISSGEKFTTPSEDPTGANRASQLVRLDQRLQADQRSIDRAESRLSVAEGAINNAGEALLRAKELALLGANGTLQTADYIVFQKELRVLAEQVLDAANSRDESGRYIFAGEQSAFAAFAMDADGTVLWQGRSAGSGAEAAGIENTFVPRGLDLFGPDTSGSFLAIDTLTKAMTEEDPELRSTLINQSLEALDIGYSRLIDGQAQIGAGRARLEDEGERISTARLQTAEALQAVNGLDLTAAIAELEALKLTLSASQAIFTRINDGTLFDRIG